MRSRYKNVQKSKLRKYISNSTLTFGIFGLKALESGYVTLKQLESAKQAISKKMNKKGKIWTKIVVNKPVTKKPLEVRMGKGKGSLSHNVACVRGGSILFEVCGLSKKAAISVFKASSFKLPIKTALFF